eukprot:15332037-Ditylum_brightwellii.AAC.1
MYALTPQQPAASQPTPHTVIDYAEDVLPQHMPTPEGGKRDEEPPVLIQLDDRSESEDKDDAVEPSPPCRYPHCTNRWRAPTLFQDFPYVAGIAELDPMEAKNREFISCLPSYEDMRASQKDSQ